MKTPRKYVRFFNNTTFERSYNKLYNLVECGEYKGGTLIVRQWDGYSPHFEVTGTIELITISNHNNIKGFIEALKKIDYLSISKNKLKKIAKYYYRYWNDKLRRGEY